MELSPGTVIDRYVVDSLLGTGGMAQVYLVTHRQLGSQHALKVLTFAGLSVRERLLQEGRSQSTLRHNNVVSVTDLIDIDGAPGLIMEYVRGPTLQQLLRQHRPTLAQIDNLARGILKGVKAAHDHGLIHRDLKPANILLSVEGGELVPKIADFGLAKAIAADGPGLMQTRTGAALGTPPYMAPEQIRDSSRVDKRSDLFSLGTVLYELMTGHQPFVDSDRMEIYKRICDAQFPPPRSLVPDLPDRMVDALNATLKSDPEDRVQDVDAMMSLWTGGDLIDSPDISLGSLPSWGEDVLEMGSDALASNTDIAGSTTPYHSPQNDTFAGSFLGVDEPETLTDETGVSKTLPILGVFVLIPLAVGMFMTMFDEPKMWLHEVGFVGPVLFALFVAGGAVAFYLGGRAAKGLPVNPLVGILFPILLLTLGRAFSGVGSELAQRAVSNTVVAFRALISGAGLKLALISDLMGLSLSTMLGVATALALATGALVHRLGAKATVRAIGLTEIKVLGGVMLGGMAIWVFGWWADYHVDLAGPTTTPIFMLALLLVVTVACLAVRASPTDSCAPSPGIQLTIALCAMGSVTDAAASALIYREWLMFDKVIEMAPIDQVEAGLAFGQLVGSQAKMVSLLWIPLVLVMVWYVFGGRRLLDMLRLMKWPGLAALALLLVASTAATLYSERAKSEVVSAIQPAFLTNAAFQNFGIELTDLTKTAAQSSEWGGVGVLVVTTGEDSVSTLVKGDIIVSMGDSPVNNLNSLIAQFKACQCSEEGKLGNCVLDSCVASSAQIPVTVVRSRTVAGGDERSSVMVEAVLSTVSSAPVDGDSQPALTLRAALDSRDTPLLLGMTPLIPVGETEAEAEAMSLHLGGVIDTLPQVRLVRLSEVPTDVDVYLWAQQQGERQGLTSILVGRMGRLGDRTLLNIERIRVSDGIVVARSYETTPDGVNGLLSRIETALQAVLVDGDKGASKESISEVVKSRIGEVQSCYEQELESDPSSNGKITLHLTIAPSGLVRAARANTERGSLGSSFNDCLVSKVSTWLFPAGASEYDFTYPFLFTPG